MGEIVVGRIQDVEENRIRVVCEGGHTGYLSPYEFDEPVDEGDVLKFYLNEDEDGSNQFISRSKVKKQRYMRRILEAQDKNEAVEARITNVFNKGISVKIFDCIRALWPASEIEEDYKNDPSLYTGRRLVFDILKVDVERERAIVSRRSAVEDEFEEQYQNDHRSAEDCETVEGRVTNIVDYGAFVDIGDVSGLLYWKDISWGRISHPSDVLEIDQKIKVVVLERDEERERISLGMKQLQPDPWDNVDEKYAEGDTVEGKVVALADYGAFVELEEGVEGLVHIREMSWERRIEAPSEMVSLGQQVEVKILDIDQADRSMSFGMKHLEPDPWNGVSERYSPGTFITGTVRNITSYGVFVELEPGIDGLVHISDLSWIKKVNHPNEVAEKGGKMDVVILDIDEERRRISLGHKQVQTNPWDQFASTYNEGTKTKGTVVRVKGNGLVVELPLTVEAFVPGSELKSSISDFQSQYSAEDELKLRVIRFDGSKKNIVLSEID